MSWMEALCRLKHILLLVIIDWHFAHHAQRLLVLLIHHELIAFILRCHTIKLWEVVIFAFFDIINLYRLYRLLQYRLLHSRLLQNRWLHRKLNYRLHHGLLYRLLHISKLDGADQAD
jgi:hypothetical protein